MEVMKGGDELELHANLDEYQKLVIQMNYTPRVAIDNAVSAAATVVKVDSACKHEVLLEAIQTLTDLDLIVNKAYFSSDGRWFMHVFHVTDRHGRKLTDASVVERSLSACLHLLARPKAQHALTTLELTGADRPGLISEVFAVLADLRCGVSAAKVWTHDGRVASLISVSDDHDKIRDLESRLRYVLQGDHLDAPGARAAISPAAAPGLADRRLHQMMAADVGYLPRPTSSPPSVSVHNWVERGYAVVAVRCSDRPKLLLDVVCAVTDMGYVVFHGSVSTDGDRACQEFYVRRSDGRGIGSAGELQRVARCLEAAIERRASDGLRVELRGKDRARLLADVTRAFRENGLRVKRAKISTDGEMVSDVFYVTDMNGGPADRAALDAVRERIGLDCVRVEAAPPRDRREDMGCRRDGGVGLLYLSGLLVRNLCILRLIRTCC